MVAEFDDAAMTSDGRRPVVGGRRLGDLVLLGGFRVSMMPEIQDLSSTRSPRWSGSACLASRWLRGPERS